MEPNYNLKRPSYEAPNPQGRPNYDQGSRGSADWKLWQAQGRTFEEWDRANNGGIQDSSPDNPVKNCSPFSVSGGNSSGKVTY